MSHLPLETEYKVIRKLCIGGNYIVQQLKQGENVTFATGNEV